MKILHDIKILLMDIQPYGKPIAQLWKFKYLRNILIPSGTRQNRSQTLTDLHVHVSEIICRHIDE